MFSFVSCFLMESASNIPKYLRVSFSLSVLMTTWFGSSTPSVMCCLPLFITNGVFFYTKFHSYIWTVYSHSLCKGFQFLFRFWQNVWCRPLYPAVHFLRMWFNSIMALTYSNGGRASTWNMPLWIFTSAKLCPLAVDSTHQVYMVFSISSTILSGTLYILRQCSIQFCGDHIVSFFVVDPSHG